LLLCKEQNSLIGEYALHGITKPMGVAALPVHFMRLRYPAEP
jgi:hypothetical protein